MSLLVHSAGTHSLIVDAGRPGSRSLGLPVGGAADRTAFSFGNALVGNEPETPALEFSLAGPTLEATAEHACVLFGAPFKVWINDRPQAVGKTFTLRPSDLLTIGTAESGLRGYLCVKGGFQTGEVMGSRSGLEPIRAGQELSCPAGRIPIRFFYALPAGDTDQYRLRVLPGTHARQFSEADFLNQEYRVTPESNRMGLRLMGRPLTRTPGELLSAPVCPGTVQITNDGQAIVLGMDAQTIGGYPRLAQVITADFDKLAQLRPGDPIRFELIDLPAAQRLYHELQAWRREWVTRLQHSVL